MPSYDTDAIKASVSITQVIETYKVQLRNGKGLCPFHEEKTPSFSVNESKGFYHCFGCGAHGDAISFIQDFCRVSFKDACEALGGDKLPDGGSGWKPVKKKAKSEQDDPYAAYKPIPATDGIKAGSPIDLINPKRDGKVWKNAKPVSVHPYHTATGELHGYVLRLEIDGQKITPQVRHTDKGWSFYPFDEPRPLYGLYTLSQHPERQVVVVEGEKAADHLRRLVGDRLNVVSWVGGTNGVNKADWTPLNGKLVVIIPDRDDPGLKAARDILDIINPSETKIIIPPQSYTKGWDVADRTWTNEGEFFEWCAKYKSKSIPDSYNVEIETEKVSDSVLCSPLTGKHSIDSRIIGEAFKNELIYDEYLRHWFRYDTVWKPAPESTVKNSIADLMDEEMPGGYAISKLRGCYEMLQMRLAAVSEEVDGTKVDTWLTNPSLLPMKNGILNLETRQLIPHSPEHLMNWCLPHEWKPEPLKYPVIEEFIYSLAGRNGASYEVLLVYLAAVLKGMAKSQKFLEVIGTPGTGKSTFIKLACQLVGDANMVTTSMEQLQQSKFETGNLYGKRLAIITDADKYGGSVEVFKAATGQDPLRYERKNQQVGQSFIFGGMVIVAANQPVQYRDTSTAMMRRRIPVHIDHRIKDSETDPDLLDKMDRELPALIRELVYFEEDYIEGVLADRAKFRCSAAHRSLVETNVIAEWLDECVVYDSGNDSKVGNCKRDKQEILHVKEWLYPNYVAFIEQSGRKSQVALNVFRRTVSEVLNKLEMEHSSIRKSDGAYITNIRLREDIDNDLPTLITKQEID